MADFRALPESLEMLGIKPTGISHDKLSAPGISDINEYLNIRW